MFMVGIVMSVDGATAKVLVETDGGCCDHCEKEICYIKSRGIEMEALNLVHARVGQKVKLKMKTITYLKEVLLLFILPVFALLLGILLGRVYLPVYIHGIGADVLSAVGGFVLFGISLVLAKLLSRGMGKKIEHKPVIESIIEE